MLHRERRYARRLQVALGFIVVFLSLLIMGAVMARPQTFAILFLWTALLLLYFSTDESWVLHKSQEEENKFWTAMSFSLPLFLLLLAEDSPVLLPRRSAMWVAAGLVLPIGMAFWIRSWHNRSHSTQLRARTVIPRNASYHNVVGALGQHSPVPLRQRVLDSVAQLEQRAGRLFSTSTEKDAEETVLASFQQASRAELNHLVMHGMLTLTLYHLRNHFGGVQYRDNLLELLCDTRLEELTTSAKVAVLDTLQSLGGFVHNNPAVQRLAAKVLLNTHGQALSRLKTLADAKGCVRSMHRLIFHDFSDNDVRQQVLEHFEAEASAVSEGVVMGRKVVSDIDDTFLCSGGKYPAGVDETYPRNAVYPGAGAFLEALDYGCQFGVKSVDRMYDVASTLDVSASSASSSSSPSTVVVGNLVFLSARPHVYKDVSERHVYHKFAAFVKAGKLHTMPTLLSGDLGSGRMFMLMGDYQPMAQKKFRNMIEYYSIYPDFTHVFVGDNGQGDVLAAELIKNKLGDKLEAVFIHLVQPLESTFGFESRAKWRFMCFYHTCVGAAVFAQQRGLVTPAALRKIADQAVAEFAQLGDGVVAEKERFDLVCDVEQANKVLTQHGLAEVPYPPASTCLFPVGSRVFVWAGVEGTVERFRSEDGVYEISLFGGAARCYLTALSPGLVAESLHVQQHAEPGQRQCEVTTAYGHGVVQHFRAEDKMYQVQLTAWPATAYLREDEVVFDDQHQQSSRMYSPIAAGGRFWGWGKSLLVPRKTPPVPEQQQPQQQPPSQEEEEE